MRTATAKVFLLIICMICSTLLSCSRSYSTTDHVTSESVNAYITQSDLQKGIKKSTNSMPSVIIPHQTHEKASVQCVVCHHRKGNEARLKRCVYCHKGMSGSTLFHDFCGKCHQAKSEGPKHCSDCHKEKKASVMNEDLQKKYASKSVYKKDYHKVHERENVRCDVCHHKEAPEKKTGADKMKYRKCRECHDGVAKMRIMHAFCKDCHKREKRGPIHCTACHEGAGEIAVKDSVILPKTGHRKPAIYFNHKAHVELYDTECIDCHHTVKNEKCSVCHTNKDQGKVINLKEAFHQQCLDCHRKTSGPKVCGKCHVQ